MKEMSALLNVLPSLTNFFKNLVCSLDNLDGLHNKKGANFEPMVKFYVGLNAKPKTQVLKSF